jgi:hypothetical protein
LRCQRWIYRKEPPDGAKNIQQNETVPAPQPDAEAFQTCVDAISALRPGMPTKFIFVEKLIPNIQPNRVLATQNYVTKDTLLRPWNVLP